MDNLVLYYLNLIFFLEPANDMKEEKYIFGNYGFQSLQN